MSKKERKKKENDDSTINQYDLIYLDSEIKKNIINEKNKLDKYYSILKSNNSTEIKQKIDDIENNSLMAEYLCLSHEILKEYSDLLKTPLKVSFIKKENDTSSHEISNKKDELIGKFLDIAKKYIPIKTYKKEKNLKYICSCGNASDFIVSQQSNTIICELCAEKKIENSIQTSFKDIERVNISQKYKYDKKIHFRDKVIQYQGKQSKKIPEKIYSDLENKFEIHSLISETGKTFHERHKNITKDHILLFLAETSNNSYYEDANLIYFYFTGKGCYDISSYEQDIYDDFNKVEEAYESLEEVDRIKFLNGQYILFQLLRKRGIKVNEDEYEILKTRERLIEHDIIYEKICNKLGWTFKSTI